MAGSILFYVLIALYLPVENAENVMDKSSGHKPIHFFENLNGDASQVSWAHAVNSEKELIEALNGPVMMLEADISSGHVIGQENYSSIPIMAHPPNTTSDISLEKWLKKTIEANKQKGIKLDFKNISVVEESLLLLNSFESQINFPVFINADILPGPLNATATPVDADRFLSLVLQYYPICILSIGWTTSYTGQTSWYSWTDVIGMAKKIQQNYIRQEITFPIRAIYLDQSYHQLKWLTNIIPNSGLTVWSSKMDNVSAQSLVSTYVNYNRDRVYYDLPPSLNTSFNEIKKSTLKQPLAGNKIEWEIDRQDLAFATTEAVVINGEGCFVIQKTQSVASQSHYNIIEGVIEFLDSQHSERLRIGVRNEPRQWIDIFATGRILVNGKNVQVHLNNKCLRFIIIDKGDLLPISVKIVPCEPPYYTGIGEKVEFTVPIDQVVGNATQLAFTSVGKSIKVVHSLRINTYSNNCDYNFKNYALLGLLLLCYFFIL